MSHYSAIKQCRDFTDHESHYWHDNDVLRYLCRGHGIVAAERAQRATATIREELAEIRGQLDETAAEVNRQLVIETGRKIEQERDRVALLGVATDSLITELKKRTLSQTEQLDLLRHLVRTGLIREPKSDQCTCAVTIPPPGWHHAVQCPRFSVFPGGIEPREETPRARTDETGQSVPDGGAETSAPDGGAR